MKKLIFGVVVVLGLFVGGIEQNVFVQDTEFKTSKVMYIADGEPANGDDLIKGNH